MTNRIKGEMDFMKKMFSTQKLEAIDENEKTVRNLGYEIELLKLNQEGNCKKADLTELD